MDQLICWMHTNQLNGWERDLCGYAASSLVFATFSMTSMRGLRLTAVTSNLAFICYALVANLHPILILHSILLPLNAFRLMQIELARAAARRRTEAGRWAAAPRIGFTRPAVDFAGRAASQALRVSRSAMHTEALTARSSRKTAGAARQAERGRSVVGIARRNRPPL